jgi:hypothetical protein
MTDANPRPPSGDRTQFPGISENPRELARPRRRRLVIKLDPQDESLAKPPLRERLLREIRTGWPGCLSSFGLHIFLLLLLWLLVAPDAYRLLGGDGGSGFELRLSSLDEKRGDNAEPHRPRQPIFDLNVSPDPLPKPNPKKAEKQPGKAAGKGFRSLPVAPVNVQSLFDNRKPERRGEVLKELDSEERIRRAIGRGLSWLQRQQKSDGHWVLYGRDAGYPDPGEYSSISTLTGATALAMLAFLGDGHTHKQRGPYQKTVAKGLKWLLGIQKPSGDFHDVDEEGRDAAFYAHSQATIVVCEAYAMTGDESLRKPAERGVQYLLDSQNPVKGGWKYRPQLPTSKGDLSVTGWALMALHSARSAGIAVNPRAYALAARFLDSVQEQDGALYKYEPRPSTWPVTSSMTAEGLLCRQFLGWPKSHPALKRGVDYLKQPANEPRWQAGGRARPHVYFWYYAGHVFHNMGGDDWKTWYQKTAMMIVARQQQSSGRKHDVHGSWPPKGRDGSYGYGEVGGRLYMTAMCLLVLETPIRHRPIYAK